MNKDIKLIAYYLPQFHRLKFNDEYWGKGFTEWTNTAKAKPLFKGHYQPHIPADLGFYDLSVQSVRREQAELAEKYGISGFCYWHYWFGPNKRVMEMPFNEVLKDKEIKLPFCLAWANHEWHNVKTREVIIKQEYCGKEDYNMHYNSLRDAFKDCRYIKIGNKPIFNIFSPFEIPDTKKFFDIWNNNAKNDGWDGMYFIGIVKTDEEANVALDMGYNAVNTMKLQNFEYKKSTLSRIVDNFKHNILKMPYVYSFKKAMKYFCTNIEKKEQVIPTIITGWDHTPRSGEKALILNNYTPEVFSEHLDNVLQHIENKENKIAFIRAWNEWAEGNHLEPDLKYGLAFLETIKKKLAKYD